MRRAQRRAHTAPDEPLINITPLIDVVFVILIAFIVIAPLLEMDRVELASGAHNGSTTHIQDASQIQIHVYKDNTIALNSQKVSAKALPKLLRDAKTRFPKMRPQLFHDKEAHFGTYQSVKTSLEAAGFQEVDVVLSPS